MKGRLVYCGRTKGVRDGLRSLWEGRNICRNTVVVGYFRTYSE